MSRMRHASASREKHGSSSLPGQLPENFRCTPKPKADNAAPHSPNLYLMLQLESTTLDGSRSKKTHVRETASEQSDLVWYAQVIESPEHVSFWKSAPLPTSMHALKSASPAWWHSGVFTLPEQSSVGPPIVRSVYTHISTPRGMRARTESIAINCPLPRLPVGPR